MAIKRFRNRRGISLSSKEKGNYKSDIRENTDPDQVNNKYSL